MRNVSPHNSNYFLPGAFLCCPHNTGRVTIFPVVPGVLFSLSSLNKSIQKHNNLMGCQPYAKHRFRQKSERCFCISSGHRDQKGPAHFPASSTEALLDVSPVAAPPIAQPGQPVKGKAAAARRCSAPLTGSPGCATSQGATGDISSRAAPFPWIGKGRGDRVEPLSSQTAVFPRLMC